MKKIVFFRALVYCVIGLFIGSVLGYFLAPRGISVELYEEAQSQILGLNIELEGLLENYTILKVSYESVLNEHSNLVTDHDELQSDYDELYNVRIDQEHDITTYQTQLDILENEKKELLGIQTELEDLLLETSMRYNDSEERYAQLEAEYQDLLLLKVDILGDYRVLVEKINLHSRHRSESEMLLITPNDPSVVQVVSDLTGGWENASDWGEYWRDVMILYNWIADEIDYDRDGYYPKLSINPAEGFVYQNDMWQFPNQTLQRMKGDCEDQAILLASMIRNYNNKSHWVECIKVGNGTEGHIALYMASDGEIFIMDPARGYYTNSGPPKYRDCHKDIHEEIDNWLYDLRNVLPNAYVEWIFADYYWKSFDSTWQFIDWLYDETS